MRLLIYLVFLGMISSCSKPSDGGGGGTGGGGGGGGGGGVTPASNIPAPASTNTTIAAYLHGYGPAMPTDRLLINGVIADKQLQVFMANTPINSDRWRSKSNGINENWNLTPTSPERVFTVTGSAYNFVDIARIKFEQFPGVSPGPGATVNLQGGAQLTYGANTFNIVSSIYFTYLNPTEQRYVISMPEMTVDSANNRWLLESFGAFYLGMPAPLPSAPSINIEYPIAAPLISAAPDSIQAWYLLNGVWTRKGHAIKAGTKYNVKVDREGVWCLAKPIKGLYKTIKFRTATGVPVVNAILRFLSGSREVAAARTDADGNAVCFLPTDAPMNVEILYEWLTGWVPAATLGISSFTDNSDITLNLPSGFANVTIIKGSLQKCGGGPVTSGFLRFHTDLYGYYQLSGFIPVTNGLFNSAVISSATTFNFVTRPIDNGSAAAVSDTVIALRSGQENVINMTTCAVPTNLYANFTVDGTPYAITGSYDTYNNPPLYSSFMSAVPSQYTILVAYSGSPIVNPGFEMRVGVAGGGVFTGWPPTYGIDWLRINGVSYTAFADATHQSAFTFSRYDIPGGYVIGTADFYFKDAGGGLHRFVGSFKLRRVG